MLQIAQTKRLCSRNLKYLLILVAVIFLEGCANFLMGDRTLNRNPIENPTVNITNFSEALSCMDELLLYYDAPIITITAQDIPNMTGGGDNIAGTKDMLITSISKISERSRRIRFVSYGTDLRDIILLHKTHEGREQFVTPDYFIRGAITQLDKNVLSSRIGTAAHDDYWNTTFSGGQGVSFAGMDLNIGLVSTLQMLPGVTSNNVLALWDRGAGVDLGGRISSVGTFFDFGIDRRDGVGQAIRNMTDLAVIEIIGKLINVPYMSCLPLNHHNAQVQQLIQREYTNYVQTPDKLIRVIQAKLKQLQLFHGEVNGVMNRKTALALEYFHNLYRSRGLTQRPRTLDFNLYYDIMYAQRPQHIQSPVMNASLSPVVEWQQGKQLSFELNEPYASSPTKAQSASGLTSYEHEHDSHRADTISVIRRAQDEKAETSVNSPASEPATAAPQETSKDIEANRPSRLIVPLRSERTQKRQATKAEAVSQTPAPSADANTGLQKTESSLQQPAQSYRSSTMNGSSEPYQTPPESTNATPQRADAQSEAYWKQRFTQELNPQGRFRPPSVQEVIHGM